MKIRILFFVCLYTSLFHTHYSSCQMIWNHGCTFAGLSSSYIAVPHSTSLNITADFTIEAWVNPDNVSGAQIILQKRAVGNIVGYTLYLSSGKVTIRTNATTRLIGKTVIPVNQWTHIAGSFSSSSGTFRVFVNGVLDTSTVIASANPLTNSDTLLIGVGNNNPFKGKMDEVRIWNISFVASDVQSLMRLSLGTNSGYYTGLVMSMSFQNADASGSMFTLNDACGNNNNGFNRGVTAFSMIGDPSSIISINECVRLDGTGDYLAAPDHSAVSPTTGVTLEAWVYPESFNANSNIYSCIFHKGNTVGTIDYRVDINLRKFRLIINETDIFSLSTSGEFFPLNQWTHLAVSYSGSSGFIKFILNGEVRWDDTNFVGNVHDNTDSLFIGGNPTSQCFDGLIDEARITSTELSYEVIANHIYTSVNSTNDPSATDVAYNFDGGLVSNSNSGPRLVLRGNTRFSHNASNSNTPVSPLSFLGNFPSGYYLSNNHLRIPATNTNGFMTSDTIDVPLNTTISDINVFVGLNHTDEDNLVISLISPSGTSVIMYNTSSQLDNSDNVNTIFNDESSFPIGNNYVTYAPSIKPANNINSVFSGTNTKGKWKLRIQDVAANDTGRLYGWGIQFNSQTSRQKILSLTTFIQGFYDSTASVMIPDTMKATIRSNVSPYTIYNEKKVKLTNAGTGDFAFTNVPDGSPVYIQLSHRNSIETWSKKPSSGTFALLFAIQFVPFTSNLTYNFSTSTSSAFGNNQIKVDNAPGRFAIYNGDENQDDIVDAADVVDIYNDVNNVTSGYVNTDLTGDDFVDISDLILAFNNANAVVGAVTP